MQNNILDRQPGTWKWGLLCLVFLAPFFFLTYGFANQYASSLSYVPSIVFAWEHHIPLWAWTIVPYWSIDLFYGLSLLLCWNRFELKQHSLRLLAAQIISISCFLIFPLKFSFERAELDGFFGLWFDVLMGFDKPFNQAPSLHIVLLVILWDFYQRHIKPSYRWLVHVWSFLIGLSVLTTWQHHFIDIPLGLLVGALCLWLFPLTVKAPYQKDGLQQITGKHLKLGCFYLIGAVVCIAPAFLFKGAWLWMLYPATSLFLVAFAYFLVRPHFFQKQENGQMTVAAWLLFAPYSLIAWINSRVWTYRHPEDSLILQLNSVDLYLGRIPTTEHSKQYHGVFDCCTELPANNIHHYEKYSTLDLIPIQSSQLLEASKKFDHFIQPLIQENEPQKALIFCALGYSRSCSVLIAWLLLQGHVSTVEEAIALIQRSRPWIVLSETHIAEIKNFQQLISQEIQP
ncbi:phosphatase PAP2/dual specificity phosphatase family protein [Acinetobacter sp. Tr-809]|uniref:phosphatase PAP2/dual specificity phosphatase family protein n=1 Tax=Acinetobacter sp. Tr-809 TaxID=2608324 RepID=UPI00141F9DB3|nr:phosphatase PAP2/dual specificity phosphatase family protein [Acinetobacter sp. Tr-809]NIE95315.1 phosphatase PAP2/dual specificity phosphatase family protein [Acinetobacter sp. Tr-809]